MDRMGRFDGRRSSRVRREDVGFSGNPDGGAMAPRANHEGERRPRPSHAGAIYRGRRTSGPWRSVVIRWAKPQNRSMGLVTGEPEGR